MAEKYKILSIDDHKLIHKIIEHTLNPTYETIFALTGDEGINLAKMHKPDIIITDVEMPGMNGYELCEKLKADPVTSHIPVIFLSSLDSLQERLNGFESGADDYIVKPFEPNDLLAKISGLTRYAEEKARLKQQIQDAENTAHLALTSGSDLGMAMQLIEHSFATNNLEELAKLLLSYAKKKELECTLFVKNSKDSICLTTKGAASPLERDLIELLRAEQDRFHDFGCRTQINFPNISLLIKNMPLGDPDEYGRIKDSFPPILTAYNEKIKSVNIENVIREQSVKLNESFSAIKETLETLGTSLHQNSQSNHVLMDKMLNDLNMKLPTMGLEDDQEDFILSKIESAVESSREASDTGENINASFTMVINQLQDLVDQQNALLESSARIQEENEIYIDKNAKNAGSMDVELF